MKRIASSSSKTANAEAYEEYLRGRDCLGRFIYHTIARKDIDEAIRTFRARGVSRSFVRARAQRSGQSLCESRDQRHRRTRRL